VPEAEPVRRLLQAWELVAMNCEQEFCPFWSGDGCACALLGIEDEDRAEAKQERGIVWPGDPE
jgi:hypothetical protein